VIGCTTVTASYAAYADVLAAAWMRFQPDVPFCVLLLDGDKSALANEGVRVIAAEELDVSPLDLQIRRAIYDPFELANSLKADLVRTLLAEGHDAVVFLDSDTDIYGPLEDVGIAAAEHGVALSPHFLRPPPSDGRYPGELDVPLKYGVFNSGFIAVGAGAGPFLEWWTGHVRRDCVDDLASAMHVDQYWLQSVPAYFEHTILRDPTLHVAHWNLHERQLEHDGGRYLVDSRPLRTFHFSGFDPERPDRIHRYPIPIPYRVDPAHNPALAGLLREYASELLAAGYRERSALGYAYATSASGLRLKRWERAVYREAALAHEAGAAFELPNPFDPADSAAFEQLISCSGSNLPLSAQALKRLAAAKKVYAEQAATPEAPAGLGTRARGFVRHRIFGSEQGHRLSSDRTALEYQAPVA
jgi:hypothetical protein